MRALLIASMVLATLVAEDARAQARDPALEGRLRAAVAAQGPGYVPRTRHVDGAGAPRYVNRLILEPSPYLRQHAHNPVDWRAWGPEALAEARRRDVPIFLSVGYATCHWCHVMEEESFDDEAVGQALNAGFVAIKVDREVLPDIDAQYMLATTILIRRGGWPNNLFLTPEGKPFAAFGYAPQSAFLRALGNVSEDWRRPEPNAQMRDTAEQVAGFVRLLQIQSAEGARVDDALFAQAAAELVGRHDAFEGGFDSAPKFPNEVFLRFLLDHAARTGDAAARDAALTTLEAIVAGGLHDHVGGGFHRYAVDPNWRTPHFEKMLYNQALMAESLLDALEQGPNPGFERALRRLLDYVIRHNAGRQAFAAAEDADSRDAAGHMEEGAFYAWTPDQLRAAVGDGAFDYAYGATGVNRSPTIPAGSVVHLPLGGQPDFASLDSMFEAMRRHREATREPPLTDDKLIVGWNGLMIGALARAGRQLGEPAYIRAAEAAAGFIGESLAVGRPLPRYYADGLQAGEATARDYAWLGLGFVALYDATFDRRWLDRAMILSDELWNRFRVGRAGPLKLSQTEGPLGPQIDADDGAVPSANASALALFARLAHRDDHARHGERADLLLGSLAGAFVDQPTAHTAGLRAAALWRGGEQGQDQWLGMGAAHAAMRVENGLARLKLSFTPGWHANAHQPLDPDLIPTSLSGLGLGATRYPASKTLNLGFAGGPVAVIDGASEIVAEVGAAEEASLLIQICSDNLCLPPEEARFRLR